MKTFRVAPGYRVELVAAEPMVLNPIFFEFDPDGRIWVVEYQGYMRDLQGRGEGDPICRVVVLEDTDEDGKADKSTVFLDKLVMPRSLAFVEGGVLVAEPPKLWYCRDTNGDLRCDSKVQAGTYGHAGNPQHTANGLRYGIDNWLHSSDCPTRHRFVNRVGFEEIPFSQLIEEPTIHRGQFGVTFDDFGRFMTCYESQPLHADLIPAEYLLRNTNFLKAYRRGGRDRSLFGVNVNIAANAREVFPIRVTPQITLGALELRDDGRLRTYTVVAGSCFYNGHQFPDHAYGNIFVPEAGGHLIGRLKLSGDIELKATRFYPAEQEFLASTDERFRPVNSRVGPDGALYIADMYHGIIEHVIFFVPWLEQQIKERRLEEGNDMGRIYRVIYEGKAVDRKRPRLSSATSTELVRHLNHPNGWWRLTAQRLLVERRDQSIGPILRETALRGTNAPGRMHALWTLEGMEALDWNTAYAAMDDTDEKVRATAIRLGERSLGRASARSATAPIPAGTEIKTRELEAQFLDELDRVGSDPSQLVRLQAMLSLVVIKAERGERLMLRLLEENQHFLFRAAAATGLQGRELEFLIRLLASPERMTPTDHHRQMIALLAQAVIDEGQPKRVGDWFRFLEDKRPQPAWVRDSILDGMLAATPRDTRGIRPIALEQEPVPLIRLTRSDDPSMRQNAYRLLSAFTWPGSGSHPVSTTGIESLSPEQKRLFEVGQQRYAIACAPCHQAHGGGLANIAPPVAGSEWVTGAPDRLVRIVLQGLYGPVEVNGQNWNLHMPGWAENFGDEEIAGILTFIRRSWGNAAEPIEPKLVISARKETSSRTIAWTAVELTEGQPASLAADSTRGRSVVRPTDKGELRLAASLAVTHGRELAYRPTLDILAPWRHEQDVAEWHLEVPNDGRYEVRVLLAADDASAGDRFVVETEVSRTTGVVSSTGGYDRFREQSCGTILLRAGNNRLLMRPGGALKRELADVRALHLIPSTQP